MGKRFKAKCKNCGFETEFNFGGGMMRFFRVYCPVPALNKKTGAFENVNYAKHRYAIKSKNLFYFDKSLKGNNEGGHVFQHFNKKLNEMNNYCPKCKQFAMNFDLIAFYD